MPGTKRFFFIFFIINILLNYPLPGSETIINKMKYNSLELVVAPALYNTYSPFLNPVSLNAKIAFNLNEAPFPLNYLRIEAGYNLFTFKNNNRESVNAFSFSTGIKIDHYPLDWLSLGATLMPGCTLLYINSQFYSGFSAAADFSLFFPVPGTADTELGITTGCALITEPEKPLISFYSGLSLRINFNHDIIDTKVAPDLIELYPALNEQYFNRGIGKMTIWNNSSRPVNIKEISIKLSSFPVKADETTIIGKILEKSNSPLSIVFKYRLNSIGANLNNLPDFKIQGAADLVLRYNYNGNACFEKKTINVRLYDSHIIPLNEYDAIGAFIASIYWRYSGAIENIFSDNDLSYGNNDRQITGKAVSVYYYFRQLHITYDKDYNLYPVKQSGIKDLSINHVSFPDETLESCKGDCEDLAVLYCSFLECLKIETGILVFPGHVIPVFNTEISAEKGYGREEGIYYNNTLWLPVDISGLNDVSFSENWETFNEKYPYSDEFIEKALRTTRQMKGKFGTMAYQTGWIMENIRELPPLNINKEIINELNAAAAYRLTGETGGE